MLPTIPPGSELEVAFGEPVAAGDVAVLIDGGRVVVHRVVAIFPAGGVLVTRGDATAVPDLPAPLSSVMGRVTGVVGPSGLRAVAPAPASASRRAILGITLRWLERFPAGGRAWVRCLWVLRRWIVSYPTAVRRRLGGGAPVCEQDQAEPAQPAGQ
jgi:hypothetical protein